MRINKKTIRDLENYEATRFIRAGIWGADSEWPDPARGHIRIELYCLGPGQSQPPHSHPEGVEIAFCLQGTGTATVKPLSGQIWVPLDNAEIENGDTILVPKGALHDFSNNGRSGMLLVTMHVPPELTDVPARSNGSSRGTAAKTEAGGTDPENPIRLLRKRIRDFEHYQPPPQDFVRERIWGMDGAPADAAKEYIHVNLYSIATGQENPLHYHPNSIEIIICLQGSGNVTVRPKKDDGWEPHQDTNFQEGDTVLVPQAALHRYLNTGPNGLLLLAMQTPQTIIHFWPDE